MWDSSISLHNGTYTHCWEAVSFKWAGHPSSNGRLTQQRQAPRAIFYTSGHRPRGALFLGPQRSPSPVGVTSVTSVTSHQFAPVARSTRWASAWGPVTSVTGRRRGDVSGQSAQKMVGKQSNFCPKGATPKPSKVYLSL